MGQVVKGALWGLLAGAALLSLYLVVMSWGSGSWDFTLRELWRLKFWVIPLILGFSLQVGLFSFLRSSKRAMAAGTSTSTVAMLACCAHHVSDVLPLVGFSAVGLFLGKYQEWFLGVGILSNLIGITLMIKQIRKMPK